MYQFDLHEHLLPDYQAMNWFVATHPESRFRKHLIAARVGEDGRHALQDDRYTKRSRDGRAEQEIITSPERLGEILAQVFHIDYRSVPGFEQRLPSLFARS